MKFSSALYHPEKNSMSKAAGETEEQLPSWREAFLYFLFLGFVSVGGPVAQITMMFNHMVEQRRWLTKDRFVKIMAFCHMLPRPEAYNSLSTSVISNGFKRFSPGLARV